MQRKWKYLLLSILMKRRKKKVLSSAVYLVPQLYYVHCASIRYDTMPNNRQTNKLLAKCQHSHYSCVVLLFLFYLFATRRYFVFVVFFWLVSVLYNKRNDKPCIFLIHTLLKTKTWPHIRQKWKIIDNVVRKILFTSMNFMYLLVMLSSLAKRFPRISVAIASQANGKRKQSIQNIVERKSECERKRRQ